MDLSHMGCSNVKGLACDRCEISSCGHPYMRTPVTYEDAKRKRLNLDYLVEDKAKHLYFLNRYSTGTCIYSDPKMRMCTLEVERRPTSCQVFPVRLKLAAITTGENEFTFVDIRVILSLKCPSSYAMAEAVMNGDQSVIKYVKTALILIEQDKDYAQYMLRNTKDFIVTLDLGSYYDWIHKEEEN